MLQPQGAGPARLDACAQDEKHSMRGHPGRTPKDVLSNQQVAEKSAGEVTEAPSFSGSKIGCLFKKGNVLSCCKDSTRGKQIQMAPSILFYDQSGVTKFPTGHKEVVVVGDAGVDKTLTTKEEVSKFTYSKVCNRPSPCASATASCPCASCNNISALVFGMIAWFTILVFACSTHSPLDHTRRTCVRKRRG